MYGTVARIKVKPGMDEQLAELSRTWARSEFERSGQVAELIFKVDDRPDEYIIVAAFPDRVSYRTNAEHPATNANYQRLRALLVADPEWNDGEIIDALGIDGI